MINIINLNKTIGDFKLLKNINLNIVEGDKIGIFAASGAGKFSLIRMINALIRPTSKQIFINGINVFDLDKNNIKILRREIGMVFQSFNLLNQYNVYENIRLSLVASLVPKELHEEKINDY